MNQFVNNNCSLLQTAAILAGGLGTRLRPVVKTSPKVLAMVNGRPFVTILLDQLAAVGCRTVVLLTGHRAAQVRRSLGLRYAGMTLAHSVEAAPLGTAGALRRALSKLETETLLLLNGDSYCEVDFVRLATEHRRRRADLTLTVARVPDASRFGEVKMALDGKVIHFGEKQNGSGRGWINAGIYLVERSLLAEIPPNQFCSLERDMLPGWVRSRRVFATKGSGRFLDIGTPSSYAVATAFFGQAS
jgi:D-glycero-alpha-D-manno-heptose 1-phosphate guanylyltransferase